MPWHKTEQVDQRLKFVAALGNRRESMTELCARFGISRKTGYKIASRYALQGPEALRDRSSRPLSHPNQTSPEVEGAILRVRRAYPSWGSKKILAVLERDSPEIIRPARSTVDAILKRAGVVTPRRRRVRRRDPGGPPVVDATAPNDVWSIDFKGWFRVGDGTRCDPLTVNDTFSRASLTCKALVSPKLQDVKRCLEQAFWQFGLPDKMLSDNGPPFGSQGLAGLSRLGVWLIRLGVRPVLIQPGRPDQNGRHERFHETLKAETAKPPRATISAQQKSFTEFQAVYNEERPHEALDMRVPGELYEMSEKPMVSKLEEHEYSGDAEVRRVRKDGTIKWCGETVFVGTAMASEAVGLVPKDEGLWALSLGTMNLGVLHERSGTVVPTDPNSTSSGVTQVPGHGEAC